MTANEIWHQEIGGGDEDEEGRRGNPVPENSLLLSKSTKGAARLNVIIRRMVIYAFSSYALRRNLRFNPGILVHNLVIRSCTPPSLLNPNCCSVVLYGCETWTLTLREEHRLRVFENKVLRKIFGAKRDEVTGEWRKLHNTELHALYSSPDIIRNIKSRRLRWAGHVAHMGESRNAYRVVVWGSDLYLLGLRQHGPPVSVGITNANRTTCQTGTKMAYRAHNWPICNYKCMKFHRCGVTVSTPDHEARGPSLPEKVAMVMWRLEGSSYGDIRTKFHLQFHKAGPTGAPPVW
ncbi:hypothetical protein ANN_21318 [Periplaneta americana]|uniref:Uncharacterized protein n=1 Tax=Periplaneta americana TaxID=6978 RepID=A0ABQ8SFU0_PERAM|nr:hypothetical protein ANN_21318 [Periplaneta americana]